MGSSVNTAARSRFRSAIGAERGNNCARHEKPLLRQDLRYQSSVRTRETTGIQPALLRETAALCQAGLAAPLLIKCQPKVGQISPKSRSNIANTSHIDRPNIGQTSSPKLRRSRSNIGQMSPGRSGSAEALQGQRGVEDRATQIIGTLAGSSSSTGARSRDCNAKCPPRKRV